MRLADYVIQALVEKGITQAFMLTGGMAMYLNDALALASAMRKTCCHHEQACSLAAVGYAQVTGHAALVQVTAGPGAVNAMNGVYEAYADGYPMLVISGQCKREMLRSTWGLTRSVRESGEQEVDAVSMVDSITKYAATVIEPSHIRYELEKALFLMQEGKPGPVWLEIPVDVQGLEVDPTNMRAFPVPLRPEPDLKPLAQKVWERLRAAKRPVLVVGNGVHSDQSEAAFVHLAEKLQCPVLCAGCMDVIQKEHPLYTGFVGKDGTRAGNITVQNADLLLCFGMSMSVNFTTYNWQELGKNAFKIVIEPDPAECERINFIGDESIICHPGQMLQALAQICLERIGETGWLQFCRERVHLLQQVQPHQRLSTSSGAINAYWFIEELCKRLTGDEILVAGNASPDIVIRGAGSLRPKQCFLANFGAGTMGYALPAAIGAAVSAAGKRRVVCVDGDGSFMLNMQELATIRGNNLPILIFIFNNGGYLSIRQSQKKHFKNQIGTGPTSGLTFPDFVMLAKAFDIRTMRLSGPKFAEQLEECLESTGPLLAEIQIDPNMEFEPRSASVRLPDGRIISSAPENMYPFLRKEELTRHML